MIRALILASLLLLLPHSAKAQDDLLAGSAVKVISNLETDAHGSGVVIEGGLVITAAHVLRDKWTLYVLTDNAEDPQLARVILYDYRADLAVLELEAPEGIAASPLDCRQARMGEPVSTVGNPGPLTFVSAWGRVSGAVRSFDRWSAVYVVDLTVVGGNSGGGVLDENGAIIGIVVGVMQTGIGGVVPISLVVPSPLLCRLLGRTE